MSIESVCLFYYIGIEYDLPYPATGRSGLYLDGDKEQFQGCDGVQLLPELFRYLQSSGQGLQGAITDLRGEQISGMCTGENQQLHADIFSGCGDLLDLRKAGHRVNGCCS